ncbi:30S ribosomal protein S14 [Rubrobacter indicoceani]|uniref:30S ribosomal protein S14 n=1 Tax=Rubrobacter indicoceani TaxID=2051957 RepID=UPI000E5AD92F|nr:30S ribosomal protein S14 [Rubrobacter indicoceani]
MARKAKIAKNEQRRETVARYAKRRAELRAVVRSPGSTQEERLEAANALARLPRDSSPTRLRNRDQLDGRSRGYYRKFGLSRINLRNLAHEGKIPGLKKASW